MQWCVSDINSNTEQLFHLDTRFVRVLMATVFFDDIIYGDHC